MTQTNIRLPGWMIDALRAQAKSRGLDFSAHVRSQLAVIARHPHDIMNVKRERASA